MKREDLKNEPLFTRQQVEGLLNDSVMMLKACKQKHDEQGGHWMLSEDLRELIDRIDEYLKSLNK